MAWNHHSTHVVPVGPGHAAVVYVALHKPVTRWKAYGVWGSFVYLVCTLGLSVRYANLLQLSATNDYYWRGFNTSGPQTFLADVYNLQLSLAHDATAPTTLTFDSTLAIPKDYSHPTTVVDLSPSRARSLLLRPISLDEIIPVLRTTPLSFTAPSPFCWVDLHRTFELAHSEKRQRRCALYDLANAAVYLEAVLRNKPTSVIVTSALFPHMNVSVFNAVRRRSAAGQAWVSAILNHSFVPVAQEIAAWRDVGVHRWMTQLSNGYQRGMEETITMHNALGLHTVIKIHSTPYRVSSSTSSSSLAYVLFSNEMLFSAIYLDSTLVRGDPDHFEELGIDWDAYVTIGPRTTPTINLVRRHIGAYGTLDIRYVAVPPSLVRSVAAFRQAYYTALRSHAAALTQYMAFPPLVTAPIPSLWQSPAMAFYGGNPLCIFGKAKPFVQASFGFYDKCTSQEPHSIAIDRDSAVFALAAVGGIDAATRRRICHANVPATGACFDSLARAASIHAMLSPLNMSMPPTLWSDVGALNVTFVQFAVDNRTEKLLEQPWITTPTDPWSFYGWITMYEWVHGQREVYTIEGDEGAVTAISPSHGFDQLVANSFDLPQNGSNYVRYITIYVTFVLGSIGLVLMLFVAKAEVASVHLFQFNRVVGSVWIGRPFLLLRGMTAVVMLSTANMVFVTSGGFSHLELHRRTWFDTAVVAGESTWVSYVVVDFWLPLLGELAPTLAPVSSAVGWAAVVVLEVWDPVVATASLQSNCTLLGIDTVVECTAGSFSIGSPHRLVWICAIHGMSVGIALASALFWQYVRRGSRPRRSPLNHLLVPMAAQALLTWSSDDSTIMDKASCVMAGMVPLWNGLFDVKLWGYVQVSPSRKHGSIVLPKPNFERKSRVLSKSAVAPSTGQRFMRASALVGLAYIAVTLAASFGYLVLTESTMANDFWWATFNTTGTQTYLSMLFTRQLQLGSSLPATQIDHEQYGDTDTAYGSSQTTITSSSLYATAIQNEVNSLDKVVHGLRKMDGCELPWIFTAFCYVDFDRRWEMANSANKQTRCLQETSNGAVYLESMLRNAQWSGLMACWGAELKTAVFVALETSAGGQAWLRDVQANANSVAAEVGHWTAKGISAYTTQWQNYKRLGVVEVVSIRNAFGISYPISIKKSNGSYDVAGQYSYKMYWGLANDLLAFQGNASLLSGKSLVRSSANYAFANTTVEAMLVTAGHLPSVLGPNLAIVRFVLGPFGSIDVRRVPCPASARILYQALTQAITGILIREDVHRYNYTAIPSAITFAPRPIAWSVGTLVGNHLFCEFGTQSGNDVFAFFSLDVECGALRTNTVRGTKQDMMKAIVAANLHQPNATATNAVCAVEMRHKSACRSVLSLLRVFLSNFALPSSSDALAAAARDDVFARLRVEYIQHIRNGSAYRLSRVRLFEEPDYDMFTWLYVFDWVVGNREVISLEGALGNVTTISHTVGSLSQAADAAEVPVNVSYYIRSCIQYVTFLLLVVGGVAASYVVAVQGYVEWWNLMEINRVAGVVWIGRPLILLRAITAISLLSTPPLELTLSTNSLVTHFTSPPRNWFTTFMSCGELSWLIYIINDTLSPVTRHFTRGYSYKSSNLAWAATFLWSGLAPVQHQFSVARDCAIDAVDFQLVCHSGTMEIGRSARFVALIGVAFGSCVVCYTFDRVRRPHLASRDYHTSFFLHDVARNNFEFARWKHDELYFLDKASAVLNGLLSVHYGDRLVVFDVKSWRAYAFDTNAIHGDNARVSLQHSIPLVE